MDWISGEGGKRMDVRWMGICGVRADEGLINFSHERCCGLLGPLICNPCENIR